MQFERAEAPAPARPRRRGVGAWILRQDWIFAVALALAVGTGVWFARSIKDFFGPSAASVMIPLFTGQTQADTMSECARVHLRCVVIATQSSERFPKDVVMSQAPKAGSHVREGRQVSLVVSTGVTIFPMPDLRFESLRNAGLVLNRLKLQLDRTTTVANDEVPSNHIIAQDPPPLTSVREGSHVSLTLSKGPPNSVKVINFTRMRIDQARQKAQAAHIKLGQIVWTPFGPDGPPRGEIVRQNPGPGALVDPFEQVSLQVSAGPTEYGYLIRQVHTTTTIPVRDNAVHVRVEIRDQTGVWNVYDGYAESGQKLDFNVTAVGTAELDTYFNNELQNSTVIGVEPKLPVPKVPPWARKQQKKTTP